VVDLTHSVIHEHQRNPTARQRIRQGGWFVQVRLHRNTPSVARRALSTVR
jgi:hypothetical protein